MLKWAWIQNQENTNWNTPQTYEQKKMKRKHIVVIYYNDNKAIPTNTYVKYEAKKK